MLHETGVELMDTPAGTTWRVTEPRVGAEMADDSPRRVADSLTEATAGSVIYVDQRGQIRTAREHGQQVTRHFVTLGLGMTAATALYWMVGGPFGLVVGAGLTLLFLREVPAHRKLSRASRLMAAERLAEAEPPLRRLVAGRLVSETMRGARRAVAGDGGRRAR